MLAPRGTARRPAASRGGHLDDLDGGDAVGQGVRKCRRLGEPVDPVVVRIARVAREAGAADLTLIHLNPRLDDLAPLLADASASFERVALGEDEMTLH